VVLAGGVLAIYLATARQQAPAPTPKTSHHHAQKLRVVKVQTIGVIDFGPDDNGDPGNTGQGNSSGHPLMLMPKGHSIDFVAIPRAELVSGKPVWTANQLSDNSEIFIYVPTGKCLVGTSADQLMLSQCDLALNQRWRPVHQRVMQGQVIAQFQNAMSNDCLTAPQNIPGVASTATCGQTGTKTQEIAFWWSA
jgi:hypothetical protein